jgi:hypothetical protein
MNIVIAATFDSMRTLKDKSNKIVLDTQELSSDQVGSLYSFNGKFVKVLLTDDNVISPKAKEAVESFEIEEDEGKSPSMRLRNILFRNWEKDSEGYKIFNDYYRAKYEVLCTHFKKKLD